MNQETARNKPGHIIQVQQLFIIIAYFIKIPIISSRYPIFSPIPTSSTPRGSNVSYSLFVPKHIMPSIFFSSPIYHLTPIKILPFQVCLKPTLIHKVIQHLLVSSDPLHLHFSLFLPIFSYLVSIYIMFSVYIKTLSCKETLVFVGFFFLWGCCCCFYISWTVLQA